MRRNYKRPFCLPTAVVQLLWLRTEQSQRSQLKKQASRFWMLLLPDGNPSVPSSISIFWCSSHISQNLGFFFYVKILSVFPSYEPNCCMIWGPHIILSTLVCNEANYLNPLFYFWYEMKPIVDLHFLLHYFMLHFGRSCILQRCSKFDTYLNVC